MILNKGFIKSFLHLSLALKKKTAQVWTYANRVNKVTNCKISSKSHLKYSFALSRIQIRVCLIF